MQLADALDLAAQGFHLFPVKQMSKLPTIGSWPTLASRDPTTLGKWSRKYPGCNFGIFTGAYGDGQALLVVDVDKKADKDGYKTLLQLELDGREFPPTLEFATPTGGRHLVYTVEAPVKQGVDVLGSGLDIRSHGGYIVAPGSVVDAGEYAVDRPARPVPAPAWLIEVCGAPRTRSSNREPKAGIDSARAEKRVIEYLKTAERSVKGAGGDQAAYRVAAKCLALGASRETALDLMLSEHWDGGSGWGAERLQQKIEHAFKYMTDTPGSEAPEAVFEPVSIVPSDEHSDANVSHMHPFDWLNKSWSLVMTGGGHHLLWETTDAKGNSLVEHVKETSFHAYYASREFQVGKKAEPLTKAWMACARRRTYDGLVFSPGRPVDARWYNLWRGFDYAFQSKPEGPSKRAYNAVQAWREHVLKNVAKGDAKLANWFTGFMAHLVQKPYEKPLVTLVLKGRKGTGKNAVLERVGALFSCNMVVADDDRYLIGNFNSHLEACLLLVLDEASWAGGKKVEGRLKGITTGQKHMIERKGMEPYSVDNLTRVAILGNEDWLVPASADERRYAVFEMGEGNMQTRAFFQEMREGMEANNGEGYGLLLDHLLNFDLTTVDVNDAPATQALADQKRESLSPQHTWWYDCLLEGQILGGDFAGEWPEIIPTNRLQDAAKRFNRDRNVSGWAPSKTAFNRSMKSIISDWDAIRSSKTGAGDTTYHYALPTLGAARAAMAQFLGGHNPFPEDTP